MKPGPGGAPGFGGACHIWWKGQLLYFSRLLILNPLFEVSLELHSAR